jgi:ribonuclease HI
MDYYVYTDGAYSTERGIGAWSFLIFTDRRFIMWKSNKSEHISSALFAEDIAIGLACYFMNTMHLDKKDRVFIYSDSLGAVELFSKITSNTQPRRHRNKLVQDAVDNYTSLANKTKVSAIKVSAHKKILTPNTCTDRLAKYHLRS